MTKALNIEQRLSALEQQMAQLLRETTNGAQMEAWIDQVAGTMKDIPAADEADQLGRDARRAMTYEREGKTPGA
jgi:hypothetical protein